MTDELWESLLGEDSTLDEPTKRLMVLYKENKRCNICKHCRVEDDSYICTVFNGDLNVEHDFTCLGWSSK